ncbi:MAG: hypothetical protein JO014_23560 [Metakosakonia sp.]|nr:hypothetical protein [Phytobacter sp.]MBV8875695.1 hypothetical protein [Phytobacter sp.]
MADELLTVAQACARLGVSERTLRRVLREPEQQAKLQATNRQVGGRNRQVAMIGPELLAVLQRRFLDGKQRAEPAGVAGGSQQAEQEAATGMTPVRLALLYEQRLSDKDALIEEQRARIVDLQAALEHEREQSKRAQTLLALGGPVERPEPFWRRWFVIRRDN